MTHYAAETFCQWLSKQTGKNTVCRPKQNGNMQPVEERKLLISSQETRKIFQIQGFWRKFFDAKTDSISSFVIYAKTARTGRRNRAK